MKKKLILKILEVSGIILLVLSIVYPVSCRMSEEGINLITMEDSGPEIKDFTVVGGRKLNISFSERVNMVESVVFGNDDNIAVQLETNENIPEAGSDEYFSVDFTMKEKLLTGKDYEIYGVVEDKSGNTLTFCIPFTGFNEDVPEIRLNEIHPKYTKSGTSTFKCEYVELYIKKGGNLSALKLFSANDGIEKAYSLPAVEVKTGEYVLFHLRTKGDGCVSEIQDDLSLSTAKYSAEGARDLWLNNENAVLGDERDIIYIEDSQSEKILDAVMYNTSKYSEWKNEEMSEIAKKVCAAGLWPESSVSSCVDVTGITATKSILRKSAGVGKDFWQLSETSGETPGY